MSGILFLARALRIITRNHIKQMVGLVPLVCTWQPTGEIQETGDRRHLSSTCRRHAHMSPIFGRHGVSLWHSRRVHDMPNLWERLCLGFRSCRWYVWMPALCWWRHGPPFQKSFGDERENIFGGGPLRSGRCLVPILKSSTCKHVSSRQTSTGDRRALRAAGL